MSAGHDDFAVEPIRGLPERPPAEERILWQGAPDWRALARRTFRVRAVVWYFGLLALARGGVALAGGGSAAETLSAASWLATLGAAAAGLLALTAWLTARATVYTITSRRVAMRIGVALTVTLNLPYRWIGSVDLKTYPDGHGDIALRLTGRTRLAYLVLWPHARPWRFARPEPALRAVPDAAGTAAILVAAIRAAQEERAQDGAAPAPERIAAE